MMSNDTMWLRLVVVSLQAKVHWPSQEDSGGDSRGDTYQSMLCSHCLKSFRVCRASTRKLAGQAEMGSHQTASCIMLPGIYLASYSYCAEALKGELKKGSFSKGWTCSIRCFACL